MVRIAPLDSFGRMDTATAGGKGANLGELVRAGFPVPDGFVITTSGYDAYVDAAGCRQDGTPRFDAPLPPGLADAICAAYRRLGCGAVAGRSSATAEDLPEASFAGQQDTFCNIEGDAALKDAVRRCWASLWTDRAVAYRARAGVGDVHLSLAVVVQRLVAAEAVGVLFTANPATGRRDEAVINAAFGFGEAVVSGEVTPDELVVCRDTVTTRITADKRVHTVAVEGGTATRDLPEADRTRRVLTDAQAIALARLGRRIEAHFGAPQDIEWVLADGVFRVVQSRPITALRAPAGPVPSGWPLPRPDGMFVRASIVEQLPDPLSPLFADLIRPAVASSLLKALTRYFGGDGFRPDGMKRMLKVAPRGMEVVFALSSDRNGVVLWR